MVPLGETRAAAARVKRRALTTLQRDAAATGDRTPTSAVPGPHASLITMATWSEWPDSNRSSSAWKAEVLPLDDTRFGCGVSCQRSRSCELVGGKDRFQSFRRHNLPAVWPALPCRPLANKKGLLGDRPRRPGSL